LLCRTKWNILFAVNTLSRGERIFRGVVGMGAVFGAVGLFVLLSILAGVAVTNPGALSRDGRSFVVLATTVWFLISFVLGMVYGGILAYLARGRSFREVSVLRVASAGIAVGLIPAIVVAVGGNGWDWNEIRDPLALFPPIGAAIGVTTLLIARRAKGDQVSSADAREALPDSTDARLI
jgi:peptidoglycan/LPS O-acetylase OafA/YrhL